MSNHREVSREVLPAYNHEDTGYLVTCSCGRSLVSIFPWLIGRWMADHDADPTKPIPADAAGLAAAREYARWFIGSSEWADLILRAYNDPEWAALKVAESRAWRDVPYDGRPHESEAHDGR